MIKIDFTKVNIAMPEDLENVKGVWFNYFEEKNETDFLPYEEKLAKMNTIVGFGRGFWAGVHEYSYIIYHTEKEKFYWYLRDIESDFDVCFYEIKPTDEIFNLLRNYSIHSHFNMYDEVLDYSTLYCLTKGMETELTPAEKTRYTFTPLEELFGEDTEALRVALMSFSPGSWGSYYPHDEYDKKVLALILGEELQQKAVAYNNGTFHVFTKNKALYVTLGEDTFKLVETKKKGEV